MVIFSMNKEKYKVGNGKLVRISLWSCSFYMQMLFPFLIILFILVSFFSEYIIHHSHISCFQLICSSTKEKNVSVFVHLALLGRTWEREKDKMCLADFGFHSKCVYEERTVLVGCGRNGAFIDCWVSLLLSFHSLSLWEKARKGGRGKKGPVAVSYKNDWRTAQGSSNFRAARWIHPSLQMFPSQVITF